MNQKNRLLTRRNLQYTVFMVFLLLAFQLSTAAQEQDSPVVGKWEKYVNGVTMTFELDKENNYTVDFESDGNFEVRGTYEVKGNTITFNDKPGGMHHRIPVSILLRLKRIKSPLLSKRIPQKEDQVWWQVPG